MICGRCNKEITIADVPEYTTLENIKKNNTDNSVFMLCKICRMEVEPKNDLHYTEAMKRMSKLISTKSVVHLKFTCHNCGARQTIEQANSFFTEGNNCEACGKTSYCEKFGMMSMMTVGATKDPTTGSGGFHG